MSDQLLIAVTKLSDWLSILDPYKHLLLPVAAISGILLIIVRVRQSRKEGILLAGARHDERVLRERYCPNLNEDEIKSATKGYVEPDCAQVDPGNESEFGKFAQIRESVFKAVDRFFGDREARNHLLILADSGVGKTSFCVNYYQHSLIKKTYPNIALVSLASPKSLKSIAAIPSKSTTVLLLDALDEDPQAIKFGQDRLAEILKACSEFRGVLITCRSHFFENDAAIPDRTGIARITPRSSQGASYDLFRLYLLPFTTAQVKAFLRQRYRFWEIRDKQKSLKLVSAIPELSARPMLLTLVPDLAKKKRRQYEIYELYQYMVEQWFEREKDWAGRDQLSDASDKLAVFLSRKKQKDGHDRASPHEIRELVASDGISLEWNLLTTRSLLNRDSEGNIKFSHRSIMEFLCVRLAISNDPRLKGIYWTNFMRELLYSYGSLGVNKARETIDSIRYLQNNRDVTNFPFAEPLAEPGLISRDELISVANHHRIEHGSARDIPVGLRYLSIVLESNKDSIEIIDKEYDLCWYLPNVDSAAFRSDPSTYRLDVFEASRPLQNVKKHRPSFAEFVSLIEAQRGWPTEERFISDQHFYWLGDWMSGGVRLLVSLNNTLTEGSGQLILSSMKSGSETVRINLYAIDPARVRYDGTLRGLNVLVERVQG